MSVEHLWYRTKYNMGRHLPLRVPVDIMLELSSQCNMSCSYCYHAKDNKLPFVKGFMDKDLAYKLIEDGSQVGVNSIKFNSRGEGTLHPDYYHIVKAAYMEHKATGAYIDRIANSNFKFGHNKEHIFEALCMMSKVKVSFDSFKKEVFETQRSGGSWELSYKNIDKFYHYPSRDNELVIQAVRTDLNKDEDLEGEIKKRWPSASASIRDVVSGRKDKGLKDKDTRDFSSRKPCKQAFVRLIIHHDGLVGVCCPDISGRLIIGDAKTETITEIFNSKKAKKIRRDLIYGSAFMYNPCSTCPSHESFKGNKGVWGS